MPSFLNERVLLKLSLLLHASVPLSSHSESPRVVGSGSPLLRRFETSKPGPILLTPKNCPPFCCVFGRQYAFASRFILPINKPTKTYPHRRQKSPARDLRRATVGQNGLISRPAEVHSPPRSTALSWRVDLIETIPPGRSIINPIISWRWKSRSKSMLTSSIYFAALLFPPTNTTTYNAFKKWQHYDQHQERSLLSSPSSSLH